MENYNVVLNNLDKHVVVSNKPEQVATNIETQTSTNNLQNSTFVPLPVIPTHDAVDGIKFDFNDGLRVLFPKDAKDKYHVVFWDLDTGSVLYSVDVPNGSMVASVKKYYIRFRLEIYKQLTPEELAEGKKADLIFAHDMDLKDKDVFVQLPEKAVGDSIAWFSYVERFQLKHGCKLTCLLGKEISDLVKDQYPNIKFITSKEVKDYNYYASYRVGLFFKGDVDHQPADFKYVGLHRASGLILGITDPTDIPPRFNLSAERTIKEPYVCIAVQASSASKMWNNPFGWREVIKFLKDSGYRVLCIDRDPIYGNGLFWNYIPHGAEDFTGNIPLQERINLIKDADFFIGLSSGLSWVAWGCKVPVVMISGFTAPENEFYTPYRVINYQVCHSCWNDSRSEFDHGDMMWCPRHKGTDRHFECTRAITGTQVINMIKTIPAFQKHMENKDKE